MNETSYSGYRFPPEIIQQAIWLYVRFTLSFRDVEDLLAERGILVSYETVRPSRGAEFFERILRINKVYVLDRFENVPLLRTGDYEPPPTVCRGAVTVPLSHNHLPKRLC